MLELNELFDTKTRSVKDNSTINFEQFSDALSNKINNFPSTIEVEKAFKYFGHESTDTENISIEELSLIIVECGSLQQSEAKTKMIILKVFHQENSDGNINWKQCIEQQNEK
jgi:Ca2+-binding EF-hand superfamily protein